MKTIINVEIPACWNTLLHLDDNAKNFKDAHPDIAVDDPNPYLNDDRLVEVKHEDVVVTVSLHSTQTNYWAEVEIEADDLYESDIIRELTDGKIIEIEPSCKYQVKIKIAK